MRGANLAARSSHQAPSPRRVPLLTGRHAPTLRAPAENAPVLGKNQGRDVVVDEVESPNLNCTTYYGNSLCCKAGAQPNWCQSATCRGNKITNSTAGLSCNTEKW